ncbi:MAG TPA: DNA primase [Holophagaceae bacterium]|nr:DNA primase [Holophagaceae bacterium]
MKDREIVEQVKEATDLVALVGQAVKLKKSGAAWSGLCPFHSERSPSFQVVPQRGFYHCFGCGKHGDAFTWVMEREGLTFPEALDLLARQAGIALPERRERPKEAVDQEERLRSVLEAAQSFYAAELLRNEAALAYLKGRGITEAFAKEAGFGAAPDAWEKLVAHLRRLDVSVDLIEQSGLASRSERGTQIDFLRNRLTIPIHDSRGRLVAFGGRVLGDEKPKYLNTRETALFKKGSTLFGMHRAKGALRDGALVVEGYFDVLQLQQEGLAGVVAPLGTALTEEHLHQVHRFTKRLVLCFDGDAAGRRAMEKSLRLALPLGFDVRLLELPPGEDPDTWCMKIGAESFREMLRKAPDWASFVIDRAMEGKDVRRVTERMEAFRELQAFLPYLPNAPETRELLASLAHQLQVPMSELDRARKPQAEAPARPLPVSIARATLDEAVRSLLLLCRAGHRDRVQSVPAAWWEGLEGAPLLQVLLDAEGDENELPGEVLTLIRGLEAQVSRRDELDAALDPEPVLGRVEAQFVDREIRTLQRQLQEPRVMADKEMQGRLEGRLSELLARKSQLARQLRISR